MDRTFSCVFYSVGLCISSVLNRLYSMYLVRFLCENKNEFMCKPVTDLVNEKSYETQVLVFLLFLL